MLRAGGVSFKYQPGCLLALKSPKPREGKIKNIPYLFVHLSRDNTQKVGKIHRLVATHFCNKPDGCDVVNHLDSNPFNNRSYNLEWTTQSGNMKHAFSLGGRHNRGENNPRSILTSDQVLEIRVKFSEGYHKSEIMEAYSLTDNMYKKIVNNISWKHLL